MTKIVVYHISLPCNYTWNLSVANSKLQISLPRTVYSGHTVSIMFIKAKDSNKPISVATLSLKMYFIGLLVLAFLSKSSLANICVDQWGFYPNPDDPNCHSFIQCQWGNPYVVDCPSGLVYNPNYKYCDWPYNYECPSNTGGNEIVY